MLACRSLFRVDRALKCSNSRVIPRLVNFSFKGHCSFYSLSYHKGMGGEKYKQSIANDYKKQKKTTTVWRPVCTKASSVKEVFVESVDSSQVQEARCSQSSDITSTSTQHVTEAVDEGVNLNPTSSTVDDDVKNRGLTVEPVVSTEKHSVSVNVGASVIRFIRGKEGSTQKKIEEEMGVKIIFPSSKTEDSIIIESSSIDSATRASEKIQMIIAEAIKSPSLDYSHFVSLPLAIHPALVDKLIDFQNSTLDNNNAANACVEANVDGGSNEDIADSEDASQQSDKKPDVALNLKVADDNRHVKVDISSIPLVSYAPKESKARNLTDLGIDKSIFIKPKTFHLTVLMLKLWNKDRVNTATEVLKSIATKVIDVLDNRPVFVKLKGLDTMKGSLAKARVVYVPVEVLGGEDRLLRACQIITDAFVEAGLVLEKDSKQKLKLHATVMNARHRKSKKWNKKFDSFDARGVFKQFGSEEWGDYHILEAHLSQRFKFDESGYYYCCASILFPESKQAD